MDENSNEGIQIDKFARLASTWESFDDLRFDVWIQSVSNAYFESGVGLKFAAAVIGVRPAELQAALNLAALPELDLSRLSNVKPPKTTWFSFAAASSEAIDPAIEALRSSKTNESPFSVVEKAIREVIGPTSLEKVIALSSTCFTHAAKKAQSFGLLSAKSQGALKSFGTAVRSGRPLSLKQAAYAKDLLKQLAVGGAITRGSPDKDQIICDQILDAIGDD
jgi:hypothetical protein